MVRRLTTPVLRWLFGRLGFAEFFNDFCGVDGTRTRGENQLETLENKAFPESTDDPTVRNVPEFASIGVQSRSLTSGGSEPELERRMIEAELSGRTTIADALARRLDALRAGGLGNVFPIRRIPS
jgi:hypothetical protein